jgi:hypothetical protein
VLKTVEFLCANLTKKQLNPTESIRIRQVKNN